ncbi:DUF2357 domain-containing protein [Gottfriedia acidiceleris]|uniref:DUF2357 domain-containing protein n=1 Tax=Gottfriedia acidiceleris TaxID=371036 RepID=UPI002F2628C8
MELHSSGVNIYIWDNAWIKLSDAYLIEGMSYRWKADLSDAFKFLLNRVAIPLNKTDYGWEGVIEIPFYSGEVLFTVNDESIKQYIYPDDRKLTNEQFSVMLENILDEAELCFEMSGLEKSVSTDKRKRNISFLQWQYIEKNFYGLRNILLNIKKNPLRKLIREQEFIKIEKVKVVSTGVEKWFDKKGIIQPSPNMLIHANQTNETYATYENQALVKMLNELSVALRKYEQIDDYSIATKAKKYNYIIQNWLNWDFIKAVKPINGSIKVTQVFRKHPQYRMFYQWFNKFFKFGNLKWDVQQNIPLKSTYELYEIWAYLQLVKFLREEDMIDNLSNLFRFETNGFFLNLAQNRESEIMLKNGKLVYQKSIQWNTKPYYSYTQKMIPDIFLELKEKVYIFDPKYRCEHNLGTALGEMHKYRDGILACETHQKVVSEVYILTPVTNGGVKDKNLFSKNYHERYGMGAISMIPGTDNNGMKDLIKELL